MPDLRLVSPGDERSVQMEPVGDGWVEAITSQFAPGDAYAFRLPDGTNVPDPAARSQRDDVHGPSLLVDPCAYRWRADSWSGRPWEEAVIYELHTGTFTEEGTFKGVEQKLDYLVETGITVVELMPVAQFGGQRGWGYDGVLIYAPHRAYGGPDGLKALVDAAHERGLMVLLDVVYNHFGPDGNYLHLYAPDFFDTARKTPWGAAIAYHQPAVRAFFVDNAMFWLEEYRLDGLRLDAINEIQDQSKPSLVEEIGNEVRDRITDRHIHLITEDDRNITRLHERKPDGTPRMYTAEWNDDFHHAVHVVATGESEGYYIDYADHAIKKLARVLSEGFAFQGERSSFWGNAPRGEPSAHLPPTAFVNFLQNHDQTGNRAFGERLTALTAPETVACLTAVLLLAPHIPLMFMGEEWYETRPFMFFTDFSGDLAEDVRKGRRYEFRHFAQFAKASAREQIPDPNDIRTFAGSRIDWQRRDHPQCQAHHSLVAKLLDIRRRDIVPRLSGVGGYAGITNTVEGHSIDIRWRLGDGSVLAMIANLHADSAPMPLRAGGRVLYSSVADPEAARADGTLPGWSVMVTLDNTADTVGVR